MIEEKAKILDAILARHGAIIELMATCRDGCQCDPDVGYHCEACAEAALFADLLRAERLFAPPHPARATAAPAGRDGR